MVIWAGDSDRLAVTVTVDIEAVGTVAIDGEVLWARIVFASALIFDAVFGNIISVGWAGIITVAAVTRCVDISTGIATVTTSCAVATAVGATG